MTKQKQATANTAPAAPPVEPVKDFRTIQVVFKVASHGELQTPTAAVQTFICTDQSPPAALASLTGYYQESELLATPKTLDLLVTAGYEDDYALLYFSPAGVQVVMEMDTWAGLVEMNGNSMLAAADFLNLQAAQVLAAKNPADPFVKIHRLDFHLAGLDEVDPAAEQEA